MEEKTDCSVGVPVGVVLSLDASADMLEEECVDASLHLCVERL